MDDLVVTLLVGLAIMFLGPVVVPMLGGRRGRLFSLVLALCFIAFAFEWSSIKGHIAAPLQEFLIRASSNGYVWAGMVAITWLYLAVDSLFAPYRGARPTRTKPSVLDKLANSIVPKLPESLAGDKEHLTKELIPWGGRKFQMFYAPAEQCVRLANELNEILKAAKLEPVSAPMLIPADVKARRGISIRSSTTTPSVEPSLALTVALRNIGIEPRLQQRPELRQFDYFFVYISE